MFDRAKYKNFARLQLKGRWAVPVLTTLICVIILNLLNVPYYKNLFGSLSKIPTISMNADVDAVSSYITEAAFDNAYTGTAFASITSWLQVLISFILAFAQINLYIKMSRNPNPVYFSDFIEGLSSWWRGILAGLWVFLWVFIWSLLFFIPGIVKSYAYSQTFFLAAEYPQLSIRKAMRVSKEITKGHKADIFVTQLSFLGWAILAAIPAGIGFFWLTPYYNMTMTNVYHALLKEAVAKGTIKAEDLAG